MSEIPKGLCQCGCGAKTKVSPANDARHGYVKGEPRKFVPGHYKRPSLPERFWSRVEKTETCWLWTGPVESQGGYGRLALGPGLGRILAHRYSYELNVGPIPDELVIDHLCCVKNCVRPDHLEAVTQRENWRRSDNHSAVAYREKTDGTRTHCVNGHDWAKEASLMGGRMRCKACKRKGGRQQPVARATLDAVDVMALREAEDCDAVLSLLARRA